MADAEQQAAEPHAAEPQPAEPQAADEPLFVRQRSTTIDLEDLPDRVFLETAREWVDKDKVGESIKEKYRKVLKGLALGAIPETGLRRRLEDYSLAAYRATPNKLIDRHTHLWGPIMHEARASAKKELETADEFREKFERQEAIHDADRIVRRARAWYIKTCKGCDRGAALIKDLRAHLQAGS